MPYELEWLDEALRVVAVRLFDPLSDEESEALQREAAALFDRPAPLYLLIDMREFDPMAMLGKLGSLPQGLPMPRLTAEQKQYSRMAIVGGGGLFRMVLQLASAEDSEALRVFAHEDEARTWLLDQARAHQGGAGFG